MLDLLFRVILSVTNEFVIIGLMTVGFFLLSRDIFGKALCLLLFTMIFNPFLKAIWQIPLPPELGNGYAFPSGHMQTSFVLWGWIIYEYRNLKLTRALALLPIGVGCALIYFGYHSPIDIAGAIGFGCTTLLLYYSLSKSRWSYKNPRLPVFTLIPLTLLILVFFPVSQMPPHVWIAEGALNGFVLGWFFLERSSLLQGKNLKEKTIIVLVALGGIIGIYILFSGIELNISLSTRLYTQYCIIALWMNFGAPLVYWICKPRQHQKNCSALKKIFRK